MPRLDLRDLEAGEDASRVMSRLDIAFSTYPAVQMLSDKTIQWLKVLIVESVTTQYEASRDRVLLDLTPPVATSTIRQAMARSTMSVFSSQTLGHIAERASIHIYPSSWAD